MGNGNVSFTWQEFEEHLVEVIGLQGYWASSFPKANDGSQPSDIIAVNKKEKHLIDAKVCSSGRFALSRVEDNQRSAMELFKERADGRGWFALLFPGDMIYMIPAEIIFNMIDSGVKSFSKVDDNLSLGWWLHEHRYRK